MINYKNLSLFLLFLLCAVLGFSWEHDSYKAWLGVASAILATAFACCILNNKFSMLIFCAFFSIVFCQFSEVARKVVKNPEYRENFNQINPTGYLVGDVIYGIKRVKSTYESELPEGINGVEQINYRYASVALAYIFISVPTIISRRPDRKAKDKKRLRK